MEAQKIVLQYLAVQISGFILPQERKNGQKNYFKEIDKVFKFGKKTPNYIFRPSIQDLEVKGIKKNKYKDNFIEVHHRLTDENHR